MRSMDQLAVEEMFGQVGKMVGTVRFELTTF
jgi:hypothetical protein